MPTKHVAQFLIRIADENPYNPVATWIESRPWDGVSRVQAFCNTVTSPAPLKDLLIRRWMLQAVAAAFSPNGIAAQGILTFVGQQNLGKTTWFERLAPEELDVVLTGHTLDPRNKDSVFVALSHWLVELGELDATFWLGLSANATGDDVLIKKTTTDVSPKIRVTKPASLIVVEVDMLEADTLELAPAEYYYEVMIRAGDTIRETVSSGSIEIQPTIIR